MEKQPREPLKPEAEAHSDEQFSVKEEDVGEGGSLRLILMASHITPIGLSGRETPEDP